DSWRTGPYVPNARLPIAGEAPIGPSSKGRDGADAPLAPSADDGDRLRPQAAIPNSVRLPRGQVMGRRGRRERRRTGLVTDSRGPWPPVVGAVEVALRGQGELILAAVAGVGERPMARFIANRCQTPATQSPRVAGLAARRADGSPPVARTARRP